MAASASLDLDELVDHWTVLDDECALVNAKHGATRLGFTLLLKFYTRHGRFPSGVSEFPDGVVEFVARQLSAAPSDLASYEWAGRTVERHRAQIRERLGFRECTVADADQLTAWLAENVTERERRPDRAREELLARCQLERIEPAVSSRVAGRLGQESRLRIATLLAVDDIEDTVDDEPADDWVALGRIKEAAGSVSLETMLGEIAKLLAVRAVGIGPEVFKDVSPSAVAGWRARAAVESPSHLRTHPEELRLAMLAALLREREREITDTLVELLISTVHRVAARAEKKATNELVAEFKRVHGKENILFRVAEASLNTPDGTVRRVVFPAVTGGEQTLRDIVNEFKTSGPLYRRTVQTTLKASYTNHYRRGLIRLLDVLDFRSSSAHQPVIEALRLIRRFADAGNITYYPFGALIPKHRGLRGDWEDILYREDTRGRRRVVRMVYEVATFQASRDALRCKEIWVAGADRWRNPDEDLPVNFAQRRVEHYRTLRKPLDPGEFIADLRGEMRSELQALNDAIPKLDWLSVAERRSGAIKLTPLDAQVEPRNLRRVKAEVLRRWGTVPLIDMLKETALRTLCLDTVTSVAGGGSIRSDVLAERLLLAIYAYGTNTGIRAVSSGAHGHNEDEIRYARRRYLTVEAARSIAVQIADATFAARNPGLWGAGSTAVASDSTHIRALDQNILTEWHSRYHGRGVLIYWHVEKQSMAAHSQLISCSASEVAAMIEGAMRHVERR